MLETLGIMSVLLTTDLDWLETSLDCIESTIGGRALVERRHEVFGGGMNIYENKKTIVDIFIMGR